MLFICPKNKKARADITRTMWISNDVFQYFLIDLMVEPVILEFSLISFLKLLKKNIPVKKEMNEPIAADIKLKNENAKLKLL